MRVVAEATGAARCIDDRAMPDPLRDQRLRIRGVPREHEHAVIVRAAVGHAAQRVDQRDVVACIGRRLAGEPRAAHARRTPERVDTDAGIVGERGKPAPVARVPRLDQRVLDERRMRLVRLADAELRLRHDVESEWLEQASKLA